MEAVKAAACITPVFSKNDQKKLRGQRNLEISSLEHSAGKSRTAIVCLGEVHDAAGIDDMPEVRALRGEELELW